MNALLTELGNVQTLPQLFAWRVARTPNAEAYRAFDDTRQLWVSLT